MSDEYAVNVPLFVPNVPQISHRSAKKLPDPRRGSPGDPAELVEVYRLFFRVTCGCAYGLVGLDVIRCVNSVSSGERFDNAHLRVVEYAECDNASMSNGCQIDVIIAGAGYT